MSELALVPLRVSLPDKIEAIDLALFPDCGQAEIVRIERSIENLNTTLSAIRNERFGPLFWRYAFLTETLLIVTVSACAFFGWITYKYAIFWGVLLGLVAAGASAVASAMVSEEHEPERQAVLTGEIEKLRAHKRRLVSREKLTGLIEQSESLQREVVAFNKALSEIDDVFGSDKEKARIMANRHKLMQKVLKFRSEVLEETEE